MDAPLDLVTLVQRATQAYASRPLFTYERALEPSNGGPDEKPSWTQMLYGDLARDEVRLRAALARLGVKRGDRVAIISKNRPEWVVVAVAVHALGGVVVPMYEAQHVDDWRHILRDAKAKVCFVSTAAIDAKVRAMLGELPALAHVVTFERAGASDVSFGHLVASGQPGDAPFVVPAPDDDAAYIYTSGTTGKPKGVKLSHRAFAFVARATRDAWGRTSSDRSVSILPWAHVGGFCELLCGIQLGGCAALLSSIERLAETMRETRPTMMVAVPRVWNALYDAIQKGLADQPPALRWLFATAIAAEKKKRAGLPLRKRERVARRIARRVLFPKVRARLGGELRLALSGAAALSKDVGEFFACLGLEVYEIYGQTEAGGVSTLNRAGAVKLGSVGKALDGVRIEIDRSVGDADDGSGEIVLHTPGAMSEYHGLPDETAAVKRADGGIRTGDLGRLDAGGFLFVTGRVREVYKLENGKFVTPVPIEEGLGLSPYIAQAFVWGLNRPHNVALLVVDGVSLRKWCEANGVRGEVGDVLDDPRVRDLYTREVAQRTTVFKGYERVRAFALLAEPFTTDNGLLTPTLKVKRGAVLARHRALLDSLYPLESFAPREHASPAPRVSR
jgi:long-chain acyl-CoA synthetase